MKYIIYDNGLNDVPVIFPEYIGHNEMVDSLVIKKENLISAGFIRFESYLSRDFKLHCYGNSQSLGIDSRGNVDTQLIRILFGG